MTAAHFERTLRALQKKVPFRRFTVELTSGFRFQIDHPEALVLRADAAVFVSADGTPTLFDHESVTQVV